MDIASCSTSSRNTDNYYDVLGVTRLSTVDQIIAEYKVKVLSCHPDKNLNNEQQSGKLFKKLQEAKVCLTDVRERADYDLWLDSGISISYEDWKTFRQCNQMTMHWCNTYKSDPMIEHPDHGGDGEQLWELSKPNDILSKFRNYDI